jgi:putative ABC transport system permease protein
MRFERWWYTLPLRWRSLLHRRQVEQDLEDEIQYHLEREVEEHTARGVQRAEARRIVLRRFGGVEQTKEWCRDARRVDLIDTAVQDVRYAARTLRRNPGFATVAIITLALGIGANTAVFSVVDKVLLSRPPFADPDRLVSVTGTYPNGAFAAMREEIRTLDVAAYADGHWLTLSGNGEPTRLATTRVSAELCSLLGVRPALGRWLRRGEDIAGRDRFVILSHALWETRFGRDAAIVGRSILLDGVAREIIAVMPPSFQFPSSRTDVWVPLGMDARETVRYWAGDFMPVIGRLRPHTTTAEAHASLRWFQPRVRERFPWRMPADWNQDVTVVPLQEALVAGVRHRLLILIAAVAVVLVAACANVANLSLSRAVARDREIAIRTAIGAAPSRIARQLLTESVVLAAVGAAAGLIVAMPTLTVLKLALPPDTPGLTDVRLNWRVLAFTGALAVATGCAFGLAPVLRALRVRVRGAMDSRVGAARRTVTGRFRAALTIAQIACAVLLVIVAGLLARSLWTLSRLDPGFQPDQVMTSRVSPAESLCRVPARCLEFYRTLDAQVKAAPAVRGSALVNTLPLTGAVAKRSLQLEGFTTPPSRAAPLFWLHVITPDYFDVMGVRFESGRAFTHEDLSGHPAVAIITASAARRFWPGDDAVGKHVRFVGDRTWRTIVGVVADVRAYDLTRSVPNWIAGILYVPFDPNATMEDGRIPTDMTLTMRTTIESSQAAAMLRRIVAGVSGEVVISDVKPMRALLADAVAAPAATTSLLVSMAGLALMLGCIGVYGVLSFLVSTQTRDFGIRFALGAQRRDVFWLVIRDGAALCLAGITVGVIGAMAVSRWLSSELHGVSATDPVTFGVVAIVVSVVTLMACYVPTRRAMRVDPLVALREQ